MSRSVKLLRKKRAACRNGFVLDMSTILRPYSENLVDCLSIVNCVMAVESENEATVNGVWLRNPGGLSLSRLRKHSTAAKDFWVKS